ncbi:MAG: 2-amino-4-hydroxy-6-hydroxymethyldihydropteridine diphosphokinase [Leptospiraceae bacterium]|nr:2-amino-4-hydroxy-6-hydroxymethyldihydropteridine diphosphokinase [Leptospiraceae bacterium]
MENTDLSQTNVLISIGSNLGDRLKYIELAIMEIKNIPTLILGKSNIIETKALEVLDQPDFLNCVIKIETTLEPIQLLDTLQQIERTIGRIKRFNKGPREIDLDILSYGNLVLSTERLNLPHHSIQSRPFIKELIENLH